MSKKFLFSLLFVLIIIFIKANDDFKVTHHSAGEIEEIVIDGYGMSICQLMELISLLNSQGNKPLKVYIPYPKSYEDIDERCLGYILNGSQHKGNTKQKSNNNKVNKINFSKNKAYIKQKIEYFLNRGTELHVHWLNNIEGIKYPQDLFISFNKGDSIILSYSEKISISNERAGRLRSLFRLLIGERNSSSKLNFDGGNMLLTPSLAVIGIDEIERAKSKEDYKAKLENLIKSKAFLYLGNAELVDNALHRSEPSFQPHYHLDLFLNLLEFETKYVFILGKAFYRLEDEEYGPVKEYNQRILELEEELKLIGEINDKEIITDFIPILIIKEGGELITYSYNNSLIEHNPADSLNSFIYLPHYNHRINLQDRIKFEIESTFTKYGFMPENIKFIKNKMGIGFNIKADGGSSLHCLVNPIKRSIPNTSCE